MVQYTFSAIASASAVPLIDAVGSGPAGTIGRFLVLFSTSFFLTQLRCDPGSSCWNFDFHDRQARPVDARVGGREDEVEDVKDLVV